MKLYKGLSLVLKTVVSSSQVWNCSSDSSGCYHASSACLESENSNTDVPAIRPFSDEFLID
jgi:hypothetical protein